MSSIHIPEKTYFKIGEVAKLLDLQPYVLRYWETEFDALAPEKTRSGQRSYRRDDIELLLLIRTLLYDEMYTIAGARRQLKLRKKGLIEVMEPEAVQRVVSERDALERERDTFLEVQRRLESAAEKLRHEASRLQLQNETLEDENAQLAAAQLEYESSIRRLRDELDARRETVRSLEDSNHSLSQKLDEAAVTLTEQSGQLDVFAGTAADAAQLEELQAEYDASQAALAAAREQLASSEEQVASLQAERTQLLAQVADTAALETLERQLTESTAALQVLRAEKDRLLQSTQSQAEKQRTRWGAMRRELETLAALVH